MGDNGGLIETGEGVIGYIVNNNFLDGKGFPRHAAAVLCQSFNGYLPSQFAWK